MRLSILALALVTMAACKESAPPAQSTTPAVADAATASASPSATGAAPTSAPLFTYVEGTDALTFWPPTTLRLVRGGATPKTCMSQLSTGNDNMWTGPDVEAAFADADVKSALGHAKQSFLPEADDAGALTEAVLETTTASLEWKLTACRWCVAPPAGVKRLHHLLAGVMMNRRLLCP